MTKKIEDGGPICSIPELRHNLDLAHTLAKSHIGFVVIPVTSRNEFAVLSVLSAKNLGIIADGGEA